MLNPEVVNFPAPESRVSYSQHTWNDMSSDDSWHQVIDDHPFNTKVSLLLPDTPTLPQIIHDAVADDGEFYLVRNLPLLELCSPTFLQAFVKTGCLNAVSCDTRLDVDNTAALTSDGLLHLILNKFTYQELRLNGSLSSHILRKPLEKYVVEVNMQKQCFKPGKAYYERVITAFTEVQLRFNFWLTWIPDNAEICPSSVAKYFHDLGYSIEEQHPCLNWNIVREAAMPLLCTASEEDPQDVLEWIGCQTLGVKMEVEGTTVCEVVTPEPNVRVNNLYVLQCIGFFSPAHLQILLQQIRLWLNQRKESAVPWVSMTVYGHPDSPVTWGNTEHVYCANGDNLYTLIILRDQLQVYRISGSRKPQRLYVKSNKNK
nr:ribonuclease P protein subunit p40-like isoform X1 [Procambarus clarkii]